MVPFILNDYVERMVQINMQESVGQRGNNIPMDAKMVQAMINNLPVMEGGPSTPLAVDGLVGPITTGAISRFQRAAQLQIIDGRIDPLGPTIRALGRTLNARSLIPRNVSGIGPVDAQILRGLTGGYTAAPRPVRFNIAASAGLGKLLDPTDWKLQSASGGSIGVGRFGGTVINFVLEKDSRPRFPRRFRFKGAGVGLSVLPVGFDWSPSTLQSYGTRLRQGPIRGSNPMPEDDFQGPCSVISVGVNVFKGWSGTLCFFGTLGPFLPVACAISAIAGEQFGTPNGSIMAYSGTVDGPVP